MMIAFNEETTDIRPNKGSAYFSVVHFEERVHIYFRRRRDYSNTMHMVSDDGLHFTLCDPVLSKSYACHNFSAYLGPRGNIEAIGGQIGPLEMAHNEGLYHFTSDDGFSFQESSLIVAANHPNYINGMSWGMDAELDGHHCCLYDERKKNYFLFLRANTGRGERAIQVSKGDSTKSYAQFSLINIGRKNEPNYYSSNFFNIGAIRFGLVPFVVDEYCSIRLIASFNYQNWWVCSDFFKSKPWYNEEQKPKNGDHPVQGIIDRGSFVEFYVHHNYLGYDEHRPVSILRYRIEKRRLYELAFSSFCKSAWSKITAPFA
ncbi:hypothetical protein [Sinorhizobium fredii]|uniref:hypothetical protein n=1 Tax=Rhizobium fredii TaxID=380 RepID=UPI003519CAA5